MPGSTELKQRILAAVDKLSADATLEDAIERLVFLAKVERGLAQAESGQLIPHDEIAKRFGQRRRSIGPRKLRRTWLPSSHRSPRTPSTTPG